MGCTTCRSLLVGLFLCLITLGSSMADANNGNIESNGLVINVDGNKELDKKTINTADQRSRSAYKWLRGRKMGAQSVEEKDLVVQVEGTVETGQANIFSRKSLDTSGMLHNKDTSRMTMEFSRRRTSVKINAKESINGGMKHAATKTFHHGSDDHDDEVNEMYNMLNKDYQSKGRRRPPINNNIPLDNVDGKP